MIRLISSFFSSFIHNDSTNS